MTTSWGLGNRPLRTRNPVSTLSGGSASSGEEDSTWSYTDEEADAIWRRVAYLAQRIATGAWEEELSSRGLREIHLYLYEDIKDYAGRFRTRDYGPEFLQVGTLRSAHRSEVADKLQRIFRFLDESIDRLFEAKTEALAAGDQAAMTEFVQNACRVAAYTHLELVAIQPFMDGNKRTTRLLADAVLVRLGLPPVTPEIPQESYRTALVTFLRTKKTEPLAVMFVEVMDELLRVAATRSPNPVADPTEATIARIVVRGHTSGRLKAGEAMLLDAFGSSWPEGLTATFAVTPGDFVRIPFPEKYGGGRGWESAPDDVTPLLPVADAALAEVVTPAVFDAAEDKVRVLTVGIDLVDGPKGAHAEFVAVFDVAARKLVRWTGKSYPHTSQVRSLVQVADLESHFVNIAGERVLVLGCHDLHMLGPRGKKKAAAAADPSRYLRSTAMQKLAKAHAPTVVLQHPHGTDTPNIWQVPWSKVEELLPSVTCYASGIGYFRWTPEGKLAKPRATLERVLRLTKGGSRRVVDVVIRAR